VIPRTVRDLNPTLTTVMQCTSCGTRFPLVDARIVKYDMVCPKCGSNEEHFQETDEVMDPRRGRTGASV